MAPRVQELFEVFGAFGVLPEANRNPVMDGWRTLEPLREIVSVECPHILPFAFLAAEGV